MEEYLDVLLDALIDTAKLLPILIIVYFLIEFLEYKKAMRFEKSKLLKGNLSPIFGSLFGCVPQCGFSVVSTDLFSKKTISIGALIAVYISTSDEALPLMLSSPKSIPYLLLLIAVKIVMGITIGYLAMFLYSRIFKKNLTTSLQTNETVEENEKDHDHEEHEEHLEGCCKHHIESEKFDWKHPLLHCVKIALFILAVNVIMGLIVLWVGEENLTNFLASSYAFQPLFACLIGLIPNCASSVIITELYLMGSISFGSIVAGLSVNAGIALIVLFKQNKNIKENLFIILMLIISSLIVGYALHFII